jgi:hypothetical protein
MLDGKIDLRRKKNQEVDDLLTSLGFGKIEDSFGYLRRMQTDAVTEENVAKIMRDRTEMEMALKTLIATSFTKMWLNDLEIFENKYVVYKTQREKIQSSGDSKTKSSISSNPKKNKK